MSTASIPVDLLNPGQVFACLGLMELSELLCGDTAARFDWSHPSGARFVLTTSRDDDPITAGLRFLADAQVHAISAAGSDHDTKKWKVETHAVSPDDPFPVPEPSSPATLPAVLDGGTKTFVLSSWADGRRRGVLSSGRDNVKFWAGSGGYPGAALLRDALDLVRTEIVAARPDPFALAQAQSSSFRFDWRRDYIPIEIGFSLNEHTNIQPRGFPLVEVLACVGLAHARPQRANKLRYRYGVIGRSASAQPDDAARLPASFLRAALGAAELPFPTRTFTMQLDWPGQENQARCITTVTEDAE